MADRVTLGLQIVQNGYFFGAQHLRQHRAFHTPWQVGQIGHPVMNRARRRHANPGDLPVIGAGVGQIAVQHMGQIGGVAIGIAAHALGIHDLAAGQRHAGVGAADIGHKRQGRGHMRILRGFGHGLSGSQRHQSASA